MHMIMLCMYGVYIHTYIRICGISTSQYKRVCFSGGNCQSSDVMIKRRHLWSALIGWLAPGVNLLFSKMHNIMIFMYHDILLLDVVSTSILFFMYLNI